MACAGFPPESLTLEPIPFAEMRPGCYDPPRAPRRHGPQPHRALALLPDVPALRRPDSSSRRRTRTLALACVRAYNDWMIDEWCGDSGGRLIPLCLVPLWDAELAAAEVRRNAARGCRAVAFTELPANLGLPSIHDPNRYWDPFLARLRRDRHRRLHAHRLGLEDARRRAPTRRRASAPRSRSLNATMSMADWLLSGALARFPRLKIAFSESQVGWMPFLLERLDHLFTVKSKAWAGPRSRDHRAALELRARAASSAASSTTWSASTCATRSASSQLVFETDYPHQDITWPHTADLVAKIARTGARRPSSRCSSAPTRSRCSTSTPAICARRASLADRKEERHELRPRHPQRHRRRRLRPRRLPRRRRRRRRPHRGDRPHPRARPRRRSTPRATS